MERITWKTQEDGRYIMYGIYDVTMRRVLAIIVALEEL
jgi:hypothetical protein